MLSTFVGAYTCSECPKDDACIASYKDDCNICSYSLYCEDNNWFMGNVVMCTTMYCDKKIFLQHGEEYDEDRRIF